MNKFDCGDCDGPEECLCNLQSDASACSGADARPADKDAVDKFRCPCGAAFYVPEFFAAHTLECKVYSSAVSPRSGDGPAWLSEYKTWLNEELQAARKLDSELYSKYHEGVADMAQFAMLKLNALLSQGHSQKQH